LVARTEKLLEEVKQECVDLGLDASKILLCKGDVTNTADLLEVRNRIESGKPSRAIQYMPSCSMLS
jgi:hypothetical protein